MDRSDQPTATRSITARAARARRPRAASIRRGAPTAQYGWVAITSSIVRDDRGRPLHIFGQRRGHHRPRAPQRAPVRARTARRLALGGAEGDELAAGAAAIVARALEVPRVALTLPPAPGAAPQLAAALGWSDEDAGFALAAGMLDAPPATRCSSTRADHRRRRDFVDRHSAVNDRLGHEAGRALRQFATRLHASREDETLAALGGDEFVVVTACEGGARRSCRMRSGWAALAEPFPLPGGEHRLDASLGVAVAARDGDGAALLRDADAAMYRAKQLGRGRSELYEAAPRPAHQRALLRRCSSASSARASSGGSLSPNWA